MKVLILCDFFNEALDYLENTLVKHYAKHGHDVTVLTSTCENVFDFIACSYDNSLPARTYQAAGATVMRRPFRLDLLHKIRLLDGVAAALDAIRPDAVAMLDIMPNLVDVVAYKRRHPSCRFVMNYSSDHSNSAKNWVSRTILHGVIRRALLRRARPCLDAIYPVTPGSARFLTELYGVPPEAMRVLPLGTDMDLGAETRRAGKGRALRHALGISDEALVVFSGGKLGPAKRTELLIEAVRGLSGVELVIAGAPETGEEDYARMLREAAGACERIHFTGWQDKAGIYAHLDMADLAAFPASQSILWVQSIAMGLPLIAGDSGGQDPSYLNLHDNIVILPNSEIRSDRLAREIGRLAADPGRLARMQDGARRVSRELLDWDRLSWETLGLEVPAGHA